MNTQL